MLLLSPLKIALSRALRRWSSKLQLLNLRILTLLLSHLKNSTLVTLSVNLLAFKYKKQPIKRTL
jgi:hypothetical protein